MIIETSEHFLHTHTQKKTQKKKKKKQKKKTGNQGGGVQNAIGEHDDLLTMVKKKLR